MNCSWLVVISCTYCILDKNEKYANFLKQYFQIFVSNSFFCLVLISRTCNDIFCLVWEVTKKSVLLVFKPNCAPPLKLANWLFQAGTVSIIHWTSSCMRLKYFGHSRYFAALEEHVITVWCIFCNFIGYRIMDKSNVCYKYNTYNHRAQNWLF